MDTTIETPATSKTREMQRVEREHGKPVEQVIADLYNHLGSHEAVAGALGISDVSLRSWLSRLGLRVRRRRSYVIE